MVRDTAEISLAPAGHAPHESLMTPASAATSEPRGASGSPVSFASRAERGRPPRASADIDSSTGVAPQAAMLDIIQRTWAEILDIEHIGPDDDFFEVGGNSLMVASAVALLGERVGIELPMRALFAAPTPTEMAESIAELRVKDDRHMVEGTTPFFPDWVIPLQRHGAGRPVFLFPGGMGGIWIMVRDAQVAALVGRDHPFYGFRRDRSHIDPSRVDWIPRLAAAYIEQMQTIQGRGPYLLYAICSGGFLVWEIAKQLLAAGEEIGGILFYEVPLRADFAQRGPPAATSRASPSRRYIPEPLPIDVTTLECEGWQAKGESVGWRDVVGGTLESIVIPGESTGPHDPYQGREAIVAEQIRRWIAQSEARTTS